MNPGDGFSVSSSIPELAMQMASTTSYIRSELNDLETKLNRLKGTWTGGGYDAYDRKQRAWDATIEQMATDFTKATNTLNNAFESYQQTDRNISAIF